MLSTKMRAKTVILAVVVSGLSIYPAHAVPILDQSFTAGGGGLLNVIGECCDFVAQTFTAGLTGRLTEVRVDISGTGQLHIEIQTVSNGVPSGVILGSTTLGTGTSSLTDPITFLQLIPVVAGTQYAIVASEIGGGGGWSGGTGDPYNRGEQLDLLRGTSTWIYSGAGYDQHFQTYVDPVPEPATVMLVGLGLGGLGFIRSKRARRLDSAPKDL